MSNQVAIETKELGKCYHLYEKPLDRLKQLILPAKKNFYQEFWALKNVSFSLNKGQSLGIIGRNGSGKSTLLQILCQTLKPSMGTAQVNGKIAALLELGAGFNLEFTGKENIFLNGSILGFSQKDMAEMYEDIVSFADIGKFIDQPVKNYSSGMFVRLAFAVQACIKPDILIVDEALSVGDIFFQQKCAKRMQDLREQGTTLIFVSHDLAIVRDLCEISLYLKNGQVQYFGPSVEAIRYYYSEKESYNHTETNNKKPIIIATKNSTEAIDQFKALSIWTSTCLDSSKDAKILAVQVIDENHSPTMQIQMTHKIKFRILYQVLCQRAVHLTLEIRNRYDHIIYASGTYTQDVFLPNLDIGQYAICEMELSAMIEAGNYTFCVMLGHSTTTLNHGKRIDKTPYLGPITVLWDYENKKAPWFGMFGIPSQVSINALE